MLSTGRGMRAAIAFVLAVASKLLPIVLRAALLEAHPRCATRRSRALVLAALYFPFRSAGILPLGAVPNVVASIRFNGPLFKGLRSRVDAARRPPPSRCWRGSRVAAWMRVRAARRTIRRRGPGRWPCRSPPRRSSIPWYLLYFTPFLFTRATLPLIVWTYSVLPVYVVWHLSRAGPPVDGARRCWLIGGAMYRAVGASAVLMVLMVLKVRVAP